MKLRGRVAVVTGAAGGIGRGIALALARRGCHLGLADSDAGALAAAAAQVEALGVRASRHFVDVADRPAVAALPEALREAHGRVDVLVNNAGVALGGTFEQVSEADFDWLMAINFNAVVGMTRAFLPLLHGSDDARIVNVSSVYGLVSPPGQSAYSASKFAVRGFSEAVRHELAENRVGVTVVHPGGIRTRIAESARTGSGVPVEGYEQGRRQFATLLTMPPETAAAQIMAAIEQRRPRLLIGWSAKVPDVLVRLLPGSYWKLIARRAAPAKSPSS